MAESNRKVVVKADVAGCLLEFRLIGFSDEIVSGIGDLISGFESKDDARMDCILEITAMNEREFDMTEVGDVGKREVEFYSKDGATRIRSIVIDGSISGSDPTRGIINVLGLEKSLETAILSSLVYHGVAERRVFLHACSVIIDGYGVLFCGPSSSGKSTIASGMQELGHLVLGDEFCCVAIDHEGKAVLHSMPFNDIGLRRRLSAPLRSIIIIDGHGPLSMKEESRVASLPQLMKYSLGIKAQGWWYEELLSLLGELVNTYSIKLMQFQKEEIEDIASGVRGLRDD